MRNGDRNPTPFCSSIWFLFFLSEFLRFFSLFSFLFSLFSLTSFLLASFSLLFPPVIPQSSSRQDLHFLLWKNAPSCTHRLSPSPRNCQPRGSSLGFGSIAHLPIAHLSLLLLICQSPIVHLAFWHLLHSGPHSFPGSCIILPLPSIPSTVYLGRHLQVIIPASSFDRVPSSLPNLGIYHLHDRP